MEAIYFAAMLVGIAWICVWSVVDKPDPGFGWWPFDMIEDAPQAEQDALARARAPDPGRRRQPTADEAASRAEPAAAQRARGASWRSRVAPQGGRAPRVTSAGADPVADPSPAPEPAGRAPRGVSAAPGRRRR